MKKHTFEITFFFQVVTLLLLIARPDVASLAAYLASVILFGFYIFTSRENVGELVEFREELSRLRNKVDGLSIAKGFMR